ncbi:basic proline-rich protein [Drepanopeziza brunnea f. sp. 'multigermtubi' MB_m1]|uniref:Basic proline-rich protein n=1 Tax=Marssonina brunnea f. sp. multigermtubi (strain MB_m1) TaxID=1072389 RepID=K1Y4B2_MARBU|nr:basic proline-rich protein [Drepanopeziza brunnea f. sp. 'multigermtubi' MB_m1]EKD20024.1 basic proline-rich protein [Drepanopeziza brunnea f. sp. 'multigermtubi' MB_m1]
MHTPTLLVSSAAVLSTFAAAVPQRPKFYFPRQIKRQYENGTIPSVSQKTSQDIVITSSSSMSRPSMSDVLPTITQDPSIYDPKVPSTTVDPKTPKSEKKSTQPPVYMPEPTTSQGFVGFVTTSTEPEVSLTESLPKTTFQPTQSPPRKPASSSKGTSSDSRPTYGPPPPPPPPPPETAVRPSREPAVSSTEPLPERPTYGPQEPPVSDKGNLPPTIVQPTPSKSKGPPAPTGKFPPKIVQPTPSPPQQPAASSTSAGGITFGPGGILTYENPPATSSLPKEALSSQSLDGGASFPGPGPATSEGYVPIATLTGTRPVVTSEGSSPSVTPEGYIPAPTTTPGIRPPVGSAISGPNGKPESYAPSSTLGTGANSGYPVKSNKEEPSAPANGNVNYPPGASTTRPDVEKPTYPPGVPPGTSPESSGLGSILSSMLGPATSAPGPAPPGPSYPAGTPPASLPGPPKTTRPTNDVESNGVPASHVTPGAAGYPTINPTIMASDSTVIAPPTNTRPASESKLPSGYVPGPGLSTEYGTHPTEVPNGSSGIASASKPPTEYPVGPNTVVPPTLSPSRTSAGPDETPFPIYVPSAPPTSIPNSAPSPSVPPTSVLGPSPSAPETILPTTTNPGSTMWLPSTIIAQYSASVPAGHSLPPQPTGISSALPRVISNPNATKQPEDTTLIQLGFLYPLNYQFVVENPMSSVQIFEYLPIGIASGLGLRKEQIMMHSLVPLDTTARMNYITTLALAYIPTNMVNTLALDLHLPTSPLYNNPDPSINTLMNYINPAIPLTPGSTMDAGGSSGMGSGDSPGSGDDSDKDNDENDVFGDTNQQNQTAGRTGATAGIAMAAIGCSAAYGAAMFLVARRYKRRKQNHRRSSSMAAGEMSQSGSPALMGGAYMSGGRNTPGINGRDRNSRGSGRTGASARTQQISAPMMAENSLGWN